jgi:RNA polymerase sigma factor (TIGR02999 family)
VYSGIRDAGARLFRRVHHLLFCIPGTVREKGHLGEFFCGKFAIAMTVEGARDISKLIAAWSGGDQEALDSLMPLIYPALRRIARQHLGRCQGGHTLESAALANEAYLKLVRAEGVRCESRAHFLALCSQIIRRIVVDHARNRGYAKRGGGLVHISLDVEDIAAKAHHVDVLALDEALASLSKFDPRKARVVELRYFGGLSVEDTAEVLGISPETAKRDWKAARAWLFGELTGKTSKKDCTSS